VNVPYIGKETQDWDLKAGANYFVFFALKKSTIQKATERFERSYILKWLSFSTGRKVVRGIGPMMLSGSHLGRPMWQNLGLFIAGYHSIR
jgi:hypothetical protein